jgi:branched-chain amino acid transport system ATP-binding protein
MLEIKTLVAGYEGSEVLHGVSLSVDSGNIVALLGPNGAGKTTLLKTVMGLIKPYQGKILLDGVSIGGLNTRIVLEKGLGFVPQGKYLYPRFSVTDDLLLGAYLVRSRHTVEERLQEVFSLFPRLRERKDTMTGMLSGGERQMLKIGRSLMLEPKTLLLDEPSLGLDPISLKIVFQKLLELNKKGLSFLLVEQNVKKAVSLAKSGYILDAGRILLAGSDEELDNAAKML